MYYETESCVYHEFLMLLYNYPIDIACIHVIILFEKLIKKLGLIMQFG